MRWGIFCFLILFVSSAVFFDPTTAAIAVSTTQSPLPTTQQRIFTIEGDTFTKDGQPFRYISGSFHYFRSVQEYWDDILSKMKLAGLNAVQTYVEWSSHQPNNPTEEYNFNGSLNLFHFLELAQKNDLLVILRPGPFIDAERDMGGLPAWLLWQKSDMKLRSSDLDYNYFVSRWFDHLLPRLVPYLYENGGPIIMVQVENEYGSFGCDKNYTTFLRDLLRRNLGSNVILFTTDGNGESYLKCGIVPDVYPTIDFGPVESGSEIQKKKRQAKPAKFKAQDIFFLQKASITFPLYSRLYGTDVPRAINIQRKFAPTGPLVNSEYYPGWLDHWQKPHSRSSSGLVANTLSRMFDYSMNVNIYMFYGGTSFGYSAGSNIDAEMLDACPTSYDYDAPLNEARDPTEKYFRIRNVISKYFPVPSPTPSPNPKGDYGPVQLKPFSYLLHSEMLQLLESSPVKSALPLSFEELKIGSGFVLYETVIDFMTSDPVLLSANTLKDRGYVYVDQVLVGVLSRTEQIMSIPIYIPKGSKLSILVENQGRPCFGSEIGESKGLGKAVLLGNVGLQNWKMYRVGELNVNLVTSYARKLLRKSTNDSTSSSNVRFPKGALGSNTFYYGNLTLDASKVKNGVALDTFVRFDGWSKGLIWVNGFNLGRYWPVVGPQKTLYLPGPLLKLPPQTNTFIIFELENAPDECVPNLNLEFSNNCNIYLTDTHVINGETPYNTSLLSPPVIPHFQGAKTNEEENSIDFNLY